MFLSNEAFLIVFFVVLSHIVMYVWMGRKSAREIANRHVVVTGGPNGIGLLLAIHAAKIGADVTIIARNVTNLGKCRYFIIMPLMHMSM